MAALASSKAFAAVPLMARRMFAARKVGIAPLLLAQLADHLEFAVNPSAILTLSQPDANEAYIGPELRLQIPIAA